MSSFVRAVLALALSFPTIASAASDADLAEIREQIRQLKEGYEARIQALEQKLKAAEAATPVVAASAPPPAPPPMPLAAVAASPGLSAFNPAISAVLQGTYANLSPDPSRYQISGFALGSDVSPGKRGFSLGESELAISANVDDKFAGNLIFSLTPENTVSVEEAYGIVTALPDGFPQGLTPKFGRFFSGLGYLNEQHQHVWDFVDAPLAYQVFLGGQYANDGVQLKWLAPTDQFLEFGAEVGNGANFPGTDRNKNGAGSATVYVHTGDDIGASHSWRAGLSYLRTRARDREYSQLDLAGNDAALGFDGRSRVAVADFVWKYAPNGNARNTNFKLQGEYFWRRERGDLTYDRGGTLGLTQTSAYASTQRGWYLQGIYQFMPYWRFGARYDRLDRGSVDYGANATYLGSPSFHPARSSLMFDYTPSEFSRIRLQLAQSRVVPNVTDNQVFLQYILSLGAHGAHRY